jgi:ATP-dependent Clp protease, protease subunit
MYKVVIGSLLLAGVILLAGAVVIAKNHKLSGSNLILSERNTLSFNQQVTDDSIAKLEMDLQTMSRSLPENDDIILVMYTPGGSVEAGLRLIDLLPAIPQRIKTLTIFSASMGFQIVQNADERLILPNGVLMSHRASGGVEGQFNGSLEKRLAYIGRMLARLDTQAADRMGMKLNSYRKLIADEYWATGEDAVSDKAADRVVYAVCDKTLEGTKSENFATPYGMAKVTFSKCPLITSPIAIKVDGASEELSTLAIEYVDTYYFRTVDFFNKYIKTTVVN